MMCSQTSEFGSFPSTWSMCSLKRTPRVQAISPKYWLLHSKHARHYYYYYSAFIYGPFVSGDSMALHKSQSFKRWVLSSLLKVLISAAWRTSVGRQFQSRGATFAKARSPNFFRRVLGTVCRFESDVQSTLSGLYGERSSIRYSGAAPHMTW